MSKIDLITLYPDTTASIRRVKVKGGNLDLKPHNPKLVPGRSVFPERRKKLAFFKKLFYRKKRFVLWVYGCDTWHTYDEKAGRLDDHWDKEQAESFINKIIAWAAAKTKLFSKFEIYVFWILLAAGLIIDMLVLRRIGF